MGGCRGKEIGGDELGALVHELVEGVLAVCARSTPNDRLIFQVSLEQKGSEKDVHQFDNQHADHPW